VFSLTKALSYFTDERAKEIKTFLDDPMGWSVAHGGAGRYPDKGVNT
jgi:hypothetical protein